ncbi:feruloyl CoA ortho-hydroxylase 1-like [Camellia sinensis]|nr:feruloyl CoA ortho-hydroxylase 1-like [Camellia sinensis]
MQMAKLSEPFDVLDFVLNQGNGVKGLSDTRLKTVPNQFIQPIEDRIHVAPPTSCDSSSSSSIPIIDVSNWDNDDPKVSESICEAAEKFGFFQIVNHGVPLEVLENVMKAGHRFFGLPVEERRKYIFNGKNNTNTSVQLKTSFTPHKEKVLEWKDYLTHIYCNGDNGSVEDEDDSKGSDSWPSVSRDQLLEYMKWAKPVIQRLLKVLMKGLNVEEIGATKENLLMGTLIVNFNHYPICPNPDLTAGVGPHSDASTITILLQDDTGGLYVRGREGWIHVTPVKGALIVNIGDVLQIMSNDHYKSIEHRAVTSARKHRISVPIFVNPGPNAVMGPLPEALQLGEKPIYKQVLYSDYFNYFFSKPHEGKQTIEYAKI